MFGCAFSAASVGSSPPVFASSSSSRTRTPRSAASQIACQSNWPVVSLCQM